MKLLHLIVFLISFSAIIGTAYNTCRQYDGSWNDDVRSYMKMADLNFSVPKQHKYRPIIPLTAKLIYEFFGPLQHPDKSQKSKIKSLDRYKYVFLLINVFILALSAGVLYFGLCKLGFHPIACAITLLAFLVSKNTNYIAGIPVTDSLYLLCVMTLIFSVWNDWRILLILSLCFGMLSKQSFLLFLPFAFIYTKYKKEVVLFGVLGCILWGVIHEIINSFYPSTVSSEWNKWIWHFNNLIPSIRTLFSFQFLFQFLFILGGFNLLILLRYTYYRKVKFNFLKGGLILLFMIAMFKAFLAGGGNMVRMVYLTFPLLGIWLAESVNVIIERNSDLIKEILILPNNN